MAWIAKYKSETYGPYPDHIYTGMKGKQATQGWIWEQVKDPVFTPPIIPKKGKKKALKKSETTGQEPEE